MQILDPTRHKPQSYRGGRKLVKSRWLSLADKDFPSASLAHYLTSRLPYLQETLPTLLLCEFNVCA